MSDEHEPMALKGLLKRDKTVSIKEMNEAIAAQGAADSMGKEDCNCTVNVDVCTGMQVDQLSPTKGPNSAQTLGDIEAGDTEAEPPKFNCRFKLPSL